jgi:hypothetical protein
VRFPLDLESLFLFLFYVEFFFQFVLLPLD